jgi:ABC-type polysaccharide/polyol phosphate export permease
VIAASVRRDWAIARTHRLPFWFDAFSVLAASALYYYLGRFASKGSGGTEFYAFAVAGIAILRLNSSLPRVVQRATQGLTEGTLELLLDQRRPVHVVMLGEAAFDLLRGLVFAVLGIVLATTLFGAPMELTPGGLAGVAVGLVGAMAVFMGLALITVAILLVLREGGALATLTGLLVPVLAGAYFPVGTLPQPLEAIARALPFGAAVDTVRAGMLDGRLDVGAAVKMLAGAAVMLAIGVAVVRWATERARRTGSLAVL